MLTKPTLLGHFASVLLLCNSSMVAMAETEPDNNTSNTADMINIGEPQTATISSVRDTDWFKFTVAQSGDYQIEVSGVGRDVDIALELYASDATTFMESKNDGFDGDPETISFANASPGNYLVKVTQTGFFGSNTGYTLTLTDITKPKVARSIKAPDNEKDIPAGTLKTVKFQLLNSDKTAVGMQGKTISFTLTKPDKTPIPLESAKTDDNGEVSVDLKEANGTSFLTMKGDYTLTATFETVSSAPVTLTVIPADPAKLTWVGTGTQPIEVPTYIATQPLTFEVRDQYDNPVTAGQTIDVQITKPDGTTATLDPPSPLTTNAEGQVKVVFTPDQAVVYTIKALSSSTEVMSSLPMLVGEATDNKSPITFTLKHKDKWIEEQKIEVSLQQPEGATASLKPNSGFTTDKDGKVTVSLEGATVAGDYTVSAKLSSSKATNSDVYAVNNEVKVSVAATAPDSLTVKGGETQTISSDDTASAQITFELEMGGNPIGGTLEVKLSGGPDKHKACLVNADTAVCDANNPATTLQVTTDATSGEGSVWLKDAKLAGEYIVTASLSNSSATSPQPVKATVKVNPGTPEQFFMGDNKPGTAQRIALKKSGEEIVNLIDQHGNAMEKDKAVKVEVSLNGADFVSITPEPTITADGTFKLPATTFAEVGKYTVKVTLDTTLVETVVEVGNLAVTEGGNQTIVVIPQSPFEGPVINKSTVITLTLRDGAGVDEISKPGTGKEVDGKTVTLTLTDDSLGNPVTGLGLVEEGTTDKPPQTSISLTTKAKGEVKIIFQAPVTVVSDPVTTYKITAEVNGLKEYTEVFVVAKKVSELVGEGEGKIWPSLDQGEQLKKRQAIATECEGKGWAWNASGKPVTSEATFYGGLKKETDTGAFQIKIVGDGEVVTKTVDDNGKFVEGTGDPVVVQGVIKVDPQDKKEVDGLFVLGENQFPEGEVYKSAKGLYMLGRPLGDIRPLNDGTKMLEELITFRRSVTPDQDDYILLEMYRGAFYYPGNLKVFFGYYTKDGTIVHNCTPIEVKISE